ncbi:MAG TPA: winged helix DNA-binding domain-containing protein [Candidatus Limnocylindrales bacterium]|nr:winged helix DNA-binding domain-containing protein [Candidatus Limnocylindrales bacterium]
MPLSARALNRATLARQLLLRREPLTVADTLRRVVSLQAQEPASPYLALWNRIEGFDAAELDRAFVAHEVVKGTSIRITLHAVLASDHGPFQEAMLPTLRASRLNDDRFRVAGLTVAQVDALLPEALGHLAMPRSNAEMEAWFDERLGVLERPGIWWAMRTYAPVVHAPTGGPWSFGPRPVYVAARDQERLGDPEAALPHLVRRYLEGFGPATVADIAQFGMLTRPRVRAAIESLGDAVVTLEGPGREPLLDVAGGLLADEDTPSPPRLLGMWDEILLAHADRSRVIPEAVRKAVIRQNGDVLPTLLVDGYVAGLWRPVDDGIEASAFAALDEDTWEALDGEARRLRAFLADRDPTVYRRYGHWWSKPLPPATVRILGR